MRIAPYCRVSTDKADQLNSLEMQKKFYGEFAERNNHEIIHMYADEGISGTQMRKRPEFMRLMRDARLGKFDMVVTKDISRMARNVVDFLQSIRELKAIGIPVVFVNTNLSTEDGELVLTMLAMVAQQESENTSKRIKFSKSLNAEKGKVPNLVYGYDKIIGDYFNLNINPFEANVVRRIYQMYINEEYGASKIAKILNEENIKTKRGCKWTQNGICRILTNRMYCGIIINGKEEVKDFLTGDRIDKPEEEWKVTERPDLAIIDIDTFEITQKKMEINKQKFSQGQRKDCKHVFSTLLKCSDCGHFFRQAKRKVKIGYKYTWVCCGRNINGADSCNNKTVIDEGELLASIKQYLTELIEDKQKVIKKIVSDFNKNYAPMHQNLKTEKEITKEIEKLKKSRQKYVDMYDNDIISMEDLKEKTDSTNNQIKKLEEKLKMIKFGITQADKLEYGLTDTFKSIGDILSTAEITNEMLKRVIDRIEVAEDGHIDIYLRLLADIGLDEKYQCSSISTYGYNRAASEAESAAVLRGTHSTRYQQGGASHQGRHGDKRKIF